MRGTTSTKQVSAGTSQCVRSSNKEALVSSLLHFSRDLSRRHRRLLLDPPKKRRAQVSKVRDSDQTARTSVTSSVDVGTLTDRPSSRGDSQVDSFFEEDSRPTLFPTAIRSSFYQIPYYEKPAPVAKLVLKKPLKTSAKFFLVRPLTGSQEGVTCSSRSYSRGKVRTGLRPCKKLEKGVPGVVGASLSPGRNCNR